MWVDLNKGDRNNFMSQTHGCLIPGYTGHCPRLKFTIGRCYGTSTRQIMKELTAEGQLGKPQAYRPHNVVESQKLLPDAKTPLPDVFNDIKYRGRNYVMGYTGYIPGLNFRYGKSYGRAVDDSMNDFQTKQGELRRSRENERKGVRSRSASKMESIHTRDEVRGNLKRFEEINKYKDNPLSPEFPPIAGYTGHIPRVKVTDASLSQRYHCAARQGLEALRQERESRKCLDKAKIDIENIIRPPNVKYTATRG